MVTLTSFLEEGLGAVENGVSKVRGEIRGKGGLRPPNMM